MKTIITSVLSILTLSFYAATHSITISGLAYSPAVLNASVGDVVTIAASSMHPLAEVEELVWNTDGSTPKTTGFGVKTSAYTFSLTAVGDVFYVCQNHVSSGMKGKIVVTNSGTTGVEEISQPPFTISTLIIQSKLFLNANHPVNQFQIYDFNGKLVYTSNNIVSNNFIDMEHFSAGLYVIKASSKSGLEFRNKFYIGN